VGKFLAKSVLSDKLLEGSSHEGSSFLGGFRMHRVSVHSIFLSSFMALAATLLLFPAAQARRNEPVTGHVYILTNSTDANAISVFNRFSDGTLAFSRTTPIGGRGSGTGLGSQGSLFLSPNRHWLFAVDAGSNQISVIAVNGGSLHPLSLTNSAGIDPIGLAYSRGYLYVLNAGDQNNQANVTIFRVEINGHLDHLAGSTQPVTSPGEVQASPSGDQLIITEKATNMIDSYKIRDDGRLSPRKSTPATGTTPFGFVFNPVSPQQFVVVDAFANSSGIAGPNAGALTSYQAQRNSTIKVLDGPVQDKQTAPCWVAIRPDGKFAYASNVINSSISIYGVNQKNGKLTLNSTVSVAGATGPTEMALTPNGNFLYALDVNTSKGSTLAHPCAIQDAKVSSNGNISAFRVNRDGSLSALQGLPSANVPISSVSITAD